AGEGWASPRRGRCWRRARASVQLDQLEAVPRRGLFAFRSRTGGKGRAALAAEAAEPLGREVVLTRLERARRRRRRGRQADQHLVDLAGDFVLARRDLASARIRPAVVAAAGGPLEEHLNHRHRLLLPQQEREAPLAFLPQEPP